ncbi:MAG: glycoside hydrolase family 68 protein [Chakrabartia sp.]
MITPWTADDVHRIDFRTASVAPVIREADRSDLRTDILYWDMWPVQQPDGHIARPRGRELWMALAAPDRGDPGLRHFEAKIHLLERADHRWRDLGPVLPNQPVPYEREWAGSALLDGDRLSLFFTGAGVAARSGGYQQALYEAHARLGADGLPGNWSTPQKSVSHVTSAYMAADAHEGEAGKIKAFRDPAYFRDPQDGQEYLVFTASLGGSQSDYNGAIGLARKGLDGWDLLPPLIHADGVNNELERAHIVFANGLYYAFWVTQRGTFHPDLRHAPNGLYGMVSDRLFGPYRPLNGSGLVLANPDQAPTQAYSWFVSADLVVASFVDGWGADTRFGGVPAPLLRLALDGERCRLADLVSA